MKRTVELFVLSPTPRLVRKATGHYRLTCRLPSARNVPFEKELLIPLQEKRVSYTCGQLFLIMCHHNHGLVLTTAESFYHSFHQPAVVQVQPMQRFVQNKQLRILHKSTSQQHQTLLALFQNATRAAKPGVGLRRDKTILRKITREDRFTRAVRVA